MYLKGYYGMGNAGDDAFLRVCAESARSYLKSEHVIASAYSLPAWAHYLVDPVYLNPTNRLICWLNARLEERAVRRSKYFIFGGGSTLFNTNNLTSFTTLFDKAPDTLKLGLGVSVGPFTSSEEECACGELLQRFDFIGLRDQMSFERVRSLSPQTPAEYTFDLAPLLFETYPKRQQNISEGVLGISLCPVESISGCCIENEAKRTRIIADVIKMLVDDHLVRSVEIHEMNLHSEYGDNKISMDLMSSLDRIVPTTLVPYSGDPIQKYTELSGCSVLLAMRLHAAVFAYMSEVPVVMLSYHEKCSQWWESIGGGKNCILDISNLDRDLIYEALKSCITGKNGKPLLTVSDAVNRSKRNWEIAAQLCS